MADRRELCVGGKPLSSLRVVDLKAELEKRSLPKSGSKKELLERLRLHLQLEETREAALKDEDHVPNLSLCNETENDFVREYLAAQQARFQVQKEAKKQYEEKVRESEASAEETTQDEDEPSDYSPARKVSPKKSSRSKRKEELTSTPVSDKVPSKFQTPESLTTPREEETPSQDDDTTEEEEARTPRTRKHKLLKYVQTPKGSEREQPGNSVTGQGQVEQLHVGRRDPPPSQLYGDAAATGSTDEKDSHASARSASGSKTSSSAESSESETVLPRVVDVWSEKEKTAENEPPVPESAVVEAEKTPTEEISEKTSPKREQNVSPEEPKLETVEKNAQEEKEEILPEKTAEEPEAVDTSVVAGKEAKQEVTEPEVKEEETPQPVQQSVEAVDASQTVEVAKEEEEKMGSKSTESVASENEPTEAVAFEKEPTEAVANENEPTEAVASEKEPTEAAASENEPPEADASEAPSQKTDQTVEAPASESHENEEKQNVEVTDVKEESKLEEPADNAKGTETDEKSVVSNEAEERTATPTAAEDVLTIEAEPEPLDQPDSAENMEPASENTKEKSTEVLQSMAIEKEQSPQKERPESRQETKAEQSEEAGTQQTSDNEEDELQVDASELVDESLKIQEEERDQQRSRTSSSAESRSESRQSADERVEERTEAKEKQASPEKEKQKVPEPNQEPMRKLKIRKSQPQPDQTEASENSGVRKRRWGTSTLLPNKKPALVISTESLKAIVPDAKPLSAEEVRLGSPTFQSTKTTASTHEEEKQLTKPEKQEVVRRVAVEVAEAIAPAKPEAVLAAAAPLLEATSPAQHPRNCVLQVSNLVRPFTVNQLKDLLARTGHLVDGKFWIDKVKSTCLVQYETEDQAEETRAALHGIHWPTSNPKTLVVDFSTPELLENRLSGKDVPSGPAVKVEQPFRVPILSSADESKRERPEKVREWDLGKVSQAEADNRLGKENRTEEGEQDIKAKDDVPAKLLDDLFRKTKTTPCIYWLPLTDAQVAEKEEMRRQRIAEREKREREAKQRRDAEYQERQRAREKERERQRARERESQRSRKRSHSSSSSSSSKSSSPSPAKRRASRTPPRRR